MAYVLPTFNLTVNVWHYATWFGNFPTTIPAADATFVENLALVKLHARSFVIPIYLLCPALTDVRDEVHELRNSAHGDIVEVPAGSGRYYGVTQCDDIGKGFSNEHRCAMLTQAAPFNVVLPAWPV